MQQPAGRALGQLASLEQQRDLGARVHHPVQLLHPRPERGHGEDLPGHQPGAGDVGAGGPGLLVQPEPERGARLVHHVVDHDRGDDLAAQRVRGHVLLMTVPQRLGEVLDQRAVQVCVVGQPGADQLLGCVDLGAGEQHGELGAGQARAGGPSLGDLLVPGQGLQPAPQLAVPLQLAQVAGVHVQHRVRLCAGSGEHHILAVVVRQHQGGHLVGHLLQQLVPLLHRHPPVAHRPVQQDLDIDLVVGGVHPGAVVDEVGVDQPAGQRELDPGGLGQAKVAALAHHLGPQLGGVDPDRVVGSVAGRGVRLAGSLDIGADPAVPQQVHRRREHRGDELGRGQRRHLGIKAEGRARLR